MANILVFQTVVTWKVFTTQRQRKREREIKRQIERDNQKDRYTDIKMCIEWKSTFKASTFSIILSMCHQFQYNNLIMSIF